MPCSPSTSVLTSLGRVLGADAFAFGGELLDRFEVFGDFFGGVAWQQLGVGA